MVTGESVAMMLAIQLAGRQNTLMETLGAVIVVSAVITVVVLLLKGGNEDEGNENA